MRRLSKPPSVLYAIDYSCGHWETTWLYRHTKDRCEHCVSATRGEPIRVTRYVPKDS